MSLQQLYRQLDTEVNMNTQYLLKQQLQRLLHAMNPLFSFVKEAKILAGRFYSAFYSTELEGIILHAEVRSSAEYREKFNKDYHYRQLYPNGFSSVRTAVLSEDVKVVYLK